jgi:hypothetical protein
MLKPVDLAMLWKAVATLLTTRPSRTGLFCVVSED